MIEPLLDPISAAAFQREHFERAPLHVSGRDPDYYRDVLSVAELERINAAHAGEVADSLLVIDRRARISPPASVRDPVRDRLQSWIDARFADGATVLWPAIARFAPGVARAQRMVEAFAGGHTIANAYRTPPRSQGFEPHFDPHDIFVLQLAGTKRWHLYAPLVELPTRALARNVSSEELGAPFSSPLLEPGDLLYLPRGVVHAAEAEESESLHVTIGFEPPTWADVHAERIQRAADRLPALRRSPLSEGHDAGDRLRARFVQSLDPVDTPDPEIICTVDQLVERTPESAAVVYASEVRACLAVPGKLHTEPLFLEGALRFAADARAPFAVRELPVELSAEAKVALAERLRAVGLLRSAR